jgi:hypothetical protein
MPDEHTFTLRQIDQARDDLYAISDDLEFLKTQIAKLPARAWVSRMGLIGLASIWTLIVAVALMLMRSI